MLLNAYRQPAKPDWERVRTFDSFPSTLGPGDRTLMAFINTLICSEEDDKIKAVILDHYPDSKQSDFKRIFEIVKRTLTVTNSTSPILSKETFVEFHKLTVAAFMGFAYTFVQLSKEFRRFKVGIRVDY
jgi:hypothetical protein